MSLVARFVLPLHCAPTLNAYARMHWAKRTKLKGECFTRMLAQAKRRRTPLPGRPLVLASRLSPRQPDQDAGWTKMPLDLLKPGDGLGFIRDDAPDAVDVRCFWAKAPARKGEVIVEVWEDPEVAK